MLLRAWSRQKQVFGALFMREIQVRWGRRNLGFAWLFAEPLVFSFPVLTVWSLIRGPFEHGLPLMPLLWSGYLPLLLFRHVTGRAMYTVRQNAAMLYHSSITPLDIILSHCLLEVIGNLAAMAFSFLVFYALGIIDLPKDYPLFLAGNLYMCWWALAVALIVAAWSERTEIVEHVWLPISYLYVFVSGFMYLAEWLPKSVRDVALIVNPPLHCYEMIRAGLFGNRIQTFYDVGYVSAILALLTLFGLWLARDVRRHLEVDW